MQAMVKICDGADARTLSGDGFAYIAPEFAVVYRNNSVSAFLDVLRANYKTVLTLVGEDYFSALALAYLDKYPASQRSLVGYGKDFDHIIDAHSGAHNLAYLSSFAKLDRAWTLAHTAADTQVHSMDMLQEFAGSGGDLERYHLRLKPDVNLVHNDWPVFALWSNLRDDTDLGGGDLEKNTEYILVWRRGLEVVYRVLKPGELAFLQALQNGDTLGLATVACLGTAPETDMGVLLDGMMAAGIFMKQDGGAHA